MNDELGPFSKPQRVDGYRQIINREDVLIIGDLLLVRSHTRKRWYEINGLVCGCEAAEHGSDCHHLRNLRGALPVTKEDGKE